MFLAEEIRHKQTPVLYHPQYINFIRNKSRFQKLHSRKTECVHSKSPCLGVVVPKPGTSGHGPIRTHICLDAGTYPRGRELMLSRRQRLGPGALADWAGPPSRWAWNSYL